MDPIEPRSDPIYRQNPMGTLATNPSEKYA